MNIAHAAVFAVALAAIALVPTAVTAQTSCEALSSLRLSNATITLAESITTENVSAPSRPGMPDWTFTNLPAFCRVALTVKPTTDSDIRIEVWLPTSKWNGKFQAVGTDGAFIAYATGTPMRPGQGGLAGTLRQGYATSSYSAGVPGDFALGHPEKVADLAYRAAHEMTIKAKAIIAAFYGKGPLFSYFGGCSTAGAQAVMTAHRFPDDYDGIIAGAPGSTLSRGFSAWWLWLASATLKEAASAIPPGKRAIIHEAVLRACDANDGLKDGLIDDPTRCKFTPEVLTCEGTDDQTCLTIAQVETVRKLLSPAINPRTGAMIFPPLEAGSELNWPAAGFQPGNAVDAFKYVFVRNPNWDWRTLDFDRDVALSDGIVGAQGTNALEPDISGFARRSGKLVLYHGWSDAAIAPQSTINYYNKIQSLMGEVATSNSARLFMMPGGAHCGGGEGPTRFDHFSVLEEWVERGKAPDRIIASHQLPDGTVDRTRPLCPYPQVARYNGTGSIDDAENFACKMP